MMDSTNALLDEAEQEMENVKLDYNYLVAELESSDNKKEGNSILDHLEANKQDMQRKVQNFIFFIYYIIYIYYIAFFISRTKNYTKKV